MEEPAKTVNLVVRCPPELLEAAKKKAKSQDLRLAQVVRMYLQKYVKEKQPDLFF